MRILRSIKIFLGSIVFVFITLHASKTGIPGAKSALFMDKATETNGQQLLLFRVNFSPTGNQNRKQKEHKTLHWKSFKIFLSREGRGGGGETTSYYPLSPSQRQSVSGSVSWFVPKAQGTAAKSHSRALNVFLFQFPVSFVFFFFFAILPPTTIASKSPLFCLTLPTPEDVLI